MIKNKNKLLKKYNFNIFRFKPPRLVDASCQTYVEMEEIGIQVFSLVI